MLEERKTHTPPEGIEERRIVDPQRTALPLEAHGARALNRFVGPNATDIEATEKDFTEGAAMRDVIEGFFEQRELRGPINVEKFIAKHFEAAKALNTIKEGDKPMPTAEEVIRSFSDLTPEELEDINRMRKPVLQLVPVTSSQRVLKDLNGNKPMDRQEDAYVSPWTEGAFERADARDGVTDGEEAIIGWNVAITEGANAPNVLEGDDVNKKLDDRLAWFQTAHGDRGTDLKRYMKLQQAGFAEETARPIDDFWGQDKTWTMLNGEPIHDSRVAGGDWSDHNRRVILREFSVGNQDDNARFRLSVMRRCA